MIIRPLKDSKVSGSWQVPSIICIFISKMSEVELSEFTKVIANWPSGMWCSDSSEVDS